MRSKFWIFLGALTLGCGSKVPDDLDTGSTTSELEAAATDGDSDGIPAADDCDDSDASIGAIADDGDCDGAMTADDCDDADESLGAIADDGDCDGTMTADDCDDADASMGSMANDADCDGTLTEADCDDEDPDSTVLASDADCDGFITVEDCDDTNPSVNPEASEDCSTLYDDNCNGDNNDLDALDCMIFYVDADGDDFGGEDSACHCAAAGAYNSSDYGDCNDADASIYPGATDIPGDDVDQDCSVVIWVESVGSAGHMNIMLTNDEPIAGFQLGLDSTGIAAASGGISEDADFTLSASETGHILLGFSLTGSTLSEGEDRVLAEIETTTTPGEACLEEVTLSSSSGTAIPFNIGACAGY